MRPDPTAQRLLLVALVALAGCEVPLDARLLEVHGVEPDRIEPTARVIVRGEGFPAGRPGRVLLDGELRRPGQEPVAVRAVAPGRASSSETVELGDVEGLIEDVGGRGTFHGAVRVEFDAADGSGAVAGAAEQLTLDFAPPATERLTAELERRRRAEAMLAFLGVTPAPDDGGDEGILVDSLRSDGPAGRAGLTKGDRIVAIDGIRIGAVTDLVPPPGAETTALSVERAGEAGTLRLSVPLAVEADPGSIAWVAGAAIAAAFLLLLLFVAPTARLTSRLVRALAFPAQPRRSPAAPAPPDGALRRFVHVVSHGAWRAMGWIAAAMALGVLPFSARVYTGGVDVGILLFSAFATRLVVGSDARSASRPTARGLGSLIRRFCLDGLPAAAAAGAVVAFSGTFRLAGIVAAQGGVPWQWYVFRNPVTFVLFPVFVAATLVPARGSDMADRGVAAQVAARAQRFVMAGLGTALFLGGWKLPGLAGDPLEAAPALRLLGAGLFVLKAWLLMGAAGRLEGSPSRWRWTLPLSLVCVAVAASTLVQPWPSMLEVVSGPALAGVTALVVLWAVVRLRRRGDDPLIAHPFL